MLAALCKMKQDEYCELKASLIQLFPEFEAELEEESEESYIGYSPPPTIHSIWLAFTPVANEYLLNASPRLLKELGKLINAEVDAGGNRENAVSTCFLEHASQVDVLKLLKPVLSGQAKQELR